MDLRLGFLTFSLHIFFGYSSDVNLTTLRFVHALWRHGDRNPLAVYPTDKKNAESTWPQGFGELTEIGIGQQYELGQFIKKRYKGFLKEDYDSREIYVRSTDYNRTLVSALANMAGMYPPDKSKSWNKLIPWQPIPIHTRPIETEFMLLMDLPCPAATKLAAKTLILSPEAKKIVEENHDFFDFLKNKTGLKYINLTNIYSVYDPLYCEDIHRDGHPWPDWVNRSIFEKLDDLKDKSIKLASQSKQLQHFRGAALFHDIASRMKKRSLNNSTLFDNRWKYYALSVHDTTIVALLANMDSFDGNFPAYAATVFVELHEKDKDFFVEVYKRNGTKSEDLHKIDTPTCNPCTIDRFLKLAETNKPNDWWAECGYPANYTVTVIG